MESQLTVCPIWTVHWKPLGDTEGAQNILSIALGLWSTLCFCKLVVGNSQETSLCLDWQIPLLTFLRADLLSKRYWWQQGECLYCRQTWNEIVQQITGFWSAPERASGSDTSCLASGPHLHGGNVCFCGVQTSKVRTVEGLPIVIFKLMLAGRVENVVWLTVHNKQHCSVGAVCFVGIQAAWGVFGRWDLKWL